MIKLIKKPPTDDVPEIIDWVAFNAQCREAHGHPKCDYCGETEACFCSQCIVPTFDELHQVYCHTCHAEHVGVETGARCPTCQRTWPKDDPVGARHLGKRW